MLIKIKSFFEQHVRIEQDEPGMIEKPDPVPLAVCALLLEMANADGEFTDQELDEIVAIMEDEFELSPENIEDLMELAEEERKESIDLWQFSKLICDNCDREEKKRIIEILWSVIYADGILNAHEDYLVHKLANVLDLSHRELIDAKMGVMKK
jgi:uncharacterized tellurite resistance protein B-like protein